MALASRFEVVSSADVPPDDLIWTRPDRPPPPVACDWRAAAMLEVRDPSVVEQTRRAARFEVTAATMRQRTLTFDFCGVQGPTGWFDIRALDDQCLVEVRVPVVLVPGGEAIETRFTSEACSNDTVATTEAVAARTVGWRDAIRSRWSRQHQIRALGTNCPCSAYDVDVDVVFVAPGVDPDAHVVNVHSGCGGPDSSNWYIDMPMDLVAHEFGHLLGLIDEYPQPEPSSVVSALADPVGWLIDLPFSPSDVFEPEPCHPISDTVSIMYCCALGEFPLVATQPTVFPFHYHFFAEWLAKTRCCEFEIGRFDAIREAARFESL